MESKQGELSSYITSDEPSYIDSLISINVTRQSDNSSKDRLTELTKRSFYLTCKINAKNNPDVICGMAGRSVLKGNKYRANFYNLSEEDQAQDKEQSQSDGDKIEGNFHFFILNS